MIRDCLLSMWEALGSILSMHTDTHTTHTTERGKYHEMIEIILEARGKL